MENSNTHLLLVNNTTVETDGCCLARRKSAVLWCALTLVISCTVGVGVYLLAGQPAVSPFTRVAEGEIRFVRLWVSSDNHTHLTHCHVTNLTKKASFGTAQYVRDLTAALPPHKLVVTQQIGANPWHFCPSPQVVVTLAGSWYINTTDGDSVVLHPGDWLFQDDSADNPGQGKHYSGPTTDGPCNQLVLAVDRLPEVHAPAASVSCDWKTGE